MNAILRLRRRAQIDRRAGAIAQFEVAGNEVGMEVREEDVLDSQTVLGGEREVLIHVTLRVDDGGRVRLLVADQVRGVREAIQIKLLQNHRSTLRDALRHVLPLFRRRAEGRSGGTAAARAIPADRPSSRPRPKPSRR